MYPLNYTLRNIQVICKTMVAGSYFGIGVVWIWLAVRAGHEVFTSPKVLVGMGVCCLALLYIAVAQLLARRNYHYAAACLIISFYILIATGIIWTWGLNAPIGELIFALVIVLAGVLLTSRHSLFAALAAGAVLMGAQVAIVFGWHSPDISWTRHQSTFGDVLTYCVVFGMLALVCWLYNRDMERSLDQAKRAESALLLQKNTLERQVKKRTSQLRHMQVEEMRHMYRFAELGQLGVALLHDLANHLTALNLEIEDLQDKEHMRTLARAKEILLYLEGIVDSTRERLQGKPKEQAFDMVRKMTEVVTFLHYKAKDAGVAIDWRPPAGSREYLGDSSCFGQVIATLVSNAIDAYPDPGAGAISSHDRRVDISARWDDTHMSIHISDWGRGIPKLERKQLFKPFHSSKKTGLGLGLFIAKQTVETSFSGSLRLSPRSDRTEFIVKLPFRHKPEPL
ncbi:MAG TPA: ATP-binding protein [Candidatus Saccharimonadia bacterium]|nr:ATP-binding protein [Candidatus Saccharimonadia bacterium]